MGFLNKQTDDNYHSIADNRMPVALIDQTYQPAAPDFWDDILKLSNAFAVTVSGCDINPKGGNREDGVDISRYSRDVVLSDCRIRAGKRYGVTIKGGSNAIRLEDIVFHGPRGKEGVDIDIGNFSDWNYSMANNITIKNCTREDGEPVTIRIGRGCDVNIIGGKVRVLVLQSVALKLYVWAKFHLQRLFNRKK